MCESHAELCLHGVHINNHRTEIIFVWRIRLTNAFHHTYEHICKNKAHILICRHSYTYIEIVWIKEIPSNSMVCWILSDSEFNHISIATLPPPLPLSLHTQKCIFEISGRNISIFAGQQLFEIMSVIYRASVIAAANINVIYLEFFLSTKPKNHGHGTALSIPRCIFCFDSWPYFVSYCAGYKMNIFRMVFFSLVGIYQPMDWISLLPKKAHHSNIMEW